MARYKCSMCFSISDSEKELFEHTIQKHKHDRSFKVQCVLHGCSAAFRNWRSYQQHVSRYHPRHEIGNIEEYENVETNNVPQYNVQEIIPNVQKSDVQIQGAKLVINVRESCKISQAAIGKMLDEVNDFVNMCSLNSLNQMTEYVDPNSGLIHIEEVAKILKGQPVAQEVFNDLRSKYKLDQFMSEKLSYVFPKTINLGTSDKWVKKKNSSQMDLVQVENNGHIIPFLECLQFLLRNDEIIEHVKSEFSKKSQQGVYETVLNGQVYKENEFFASHPKALAIILYYDDLGVANPLGTKSSKRKLSVFYWTLANISPLFRSRFNVNMLLAVVETRFLKKHENGLRKLLRPFVEDIIKLQSDGIEVGTPETREIYRGSLLFASGDTPASALLGGFKESVAAYRFCRSCLVTHEDWQSKFREDNVTLRNMQTHKEHVEAITDPTLHPKTRKYWSKKFGINYSSVLSEIPHFDVTQSLPHDPMHVLIEGVVGIEISCFLRFLIVEMNLFTLDDLNDRINHFDFGHFNANKPAPIQQIDDGNFVKQTASEMLALLHVLPFLIADWIDDDIKEHVLLHALLSQILNICMAYEILEESIYMLSRMIETFLFKFNELYPGKMVPKFHFLIHFPNAIRLFGPPRQQACFSFERAHQYIKNLVPVVRNFKNITYTVAYRYQVNNCSQLFSFDGTSKNVLDLGDHIKTGSIVSLANLPNAYIFSDYISDPFNNVHVMRSSEVKRLHNTYKDGSIIIINIKEDSMPLFGRINEIIVYNQKPLFVYSELMSVYSEIFNAYQITDSNNNEQKVIAIDEITFPHVIPQFVFKNKLFLLLLNSDRTEFYG